MNNEGLRERKKRATRDAIAASARELFAMRGFESVTVAEVAAAADVSEKTVFNHFAAKEDLVFGGGEDRVAQLARDIKERPPGVSVLEVFRAMTVTWLDVIASSDADAHLVVPRIIRSSPALQARLAVLWEDEAAALTAAIAEATGAADDDLMPAVVARTLGWTHRTVFRTAFAALLEGDDPEQVIARLRAAADRAYDELAGGLGEYGRRGG